MSGRAALGVEYNEMILALKQLRLSSCEGLQLKARSNIGKSTRKAEPTEILCFCNAGGVRWAGSQELWHEEGLVRRKIAASYEQARLLSGWHDISNIFATLIVL